MIKFQDLQKDDYEEILNSEDSSLANELFKGWISKGVTKCPRQNVSQSNFQKYINKWEVTGDVNAYSILREYKDTKKYKLLKKIRVCKPETNFKKVEEVDLSEVQIEEAPKIVTEEHPQQIIHSVKPVEVTCEPISKPEPKKKSKVGKVIITIGIIAVIAAVVVIKFFV